MRSRRAAAALAIAALAVLALAAAAAWILHVPTAGGVRFSADDCRRFALIDADTDRPVVGAEDIALTSDGAHLIVSAYDRFAHERRSEADGAGIDGNLYAVPAAALAGDSFAAAPLVDAPAFPGGFRPHGIAVGPGDADSVGDLLLAVRRSDPGPGAETGSAAPARGPEAAGDAVTIEVFRLARSAPAGPTARVGSREAGAAALSHLASFGDPRLCRANDLAAAGASLFVTLDRIECGPGWRDLVLGGTGRVLRLALNPDTGALTDPEIAADAIDFANGILHDPARARLAVAATRGGRIVLFAAPDAADTDTDTDTESEAARSDGGAAASGPLGAPLAAIEVAGGGPDNLSFAEGGRIIAAVHPNLVRLALYRAGWPGGANAPSRIVTIDPAGGAEEVLFDDPGGRLFSAATSAVLVSSSRLFAGSVGDAGLLVCEKTAAAPTETTTLRPAAESRERARRAPATVLTASMTAPHLVAALRGPAGGESASIFGAPAQGFGAPARGFGASVRGFGAPARVLASSTVASARRMHPDARRA